MSWKKRLIEIFIIEQAKFYPSDSETQSIVIAIYYPLFECKSPNQLSSIALLHFSPPFLLFSRVADGRVCGGARATRGMVRLDDGI